MKMIIGGLLLLAAAQTSAGYLWNDNNRARVVGDNAAHVQRD